MTTSIRLKRLEKLALQRASQIVLFELSDPRLEFLTLTRAKLSSDLSHLRLFWSCIGTEADRNKIAHALADAAGEVQRGIGDALRTRRTPRVKFEYDASIAGAIEMGRLLDDLKHERAARGDDEELPPEELPVDDVS